MMKIFVSLLCQAVSFVLKLVIGPFLLTPCRRSITVSSDLHNMTFSISFLGFQNISRLKRYMNQKNKFDDEFLYIILGCHTGA